MNLFLSLYFIFCEFFLSLKIDEELFEGEYFDGKKSGIGKEYYNGLLVYEGNFQHGKKMEKESNIIHIMVHYRSRVNF